MGKLIQAANRFAFKKLAWGVVVMVTAQVLGNLNQLKGVVPDRLITISTFVLGVFLSVGKGVEMFYDNSSQLVSRDNPIDKPDGVTQTPNP